MRIILFVLGLAFASGVGAWIRMQPWPWWAKDGADVITVATALTLFAGVAPRRVQGAGPRDRTNNANR